MEYHIGGYLNGGIMAPEEFHRALRRGRIESFLGRISGRLHRLLSFETIKRELHLVSRVERGRQEIPLEQIIGSVGKEELFTRSLMPLSTRLENRWRTIYTLMQGSRGVPPIEVYMVKDSNSA